MVKFILSFINLCTAMGIGILIMIFGWGLEPVSWGWILGGGLAANLLGGLVIAIVDS